MRAYDRDDLLFQLFEVAGLEDLINGTDLDREAVMGILETADQIATDHFLPHGRLLDEQEPDFSDGRAMIPDEAVTAADEALEMSRSGLDCAFEPNLLWRRGQALRQVDVAAAEASLRDGMAVGDKIGSHYYAFLCALELAELLLADGRSDAENGALAAAMARISSSEPIPALTRAAEVLRDL